MTSVRSAALCVSSVTMLVFNFTLLAAEPFQYDFADIKIPAATADEPLRESVSTALAVDYLEHGSMAWNGQRKCVSCHTNGTYMTVRPALSPTLGKPAETTRQFFVETLAALQKDERRKLKQGTRPAQVIYLAAGLAEWDRHVAGSLSPETDQALALMFDIQNDQGTWGTLDCWPPYESDAFHEANVAGMAVATAPGWLEKTLAATNDDGSPTELRQSVELLQTYLRTQTPPHDYGRTLLLWTNTRWVGLLDAAAQQSLVDLLRGHQREDGGWSIRTFAAPEAWGKGNRAEKLRAEPDYLSPASDGHMTGLAIITLRSAGVPGDDPAIVRGVKWLQTHQRSSGRWWTRSLNTDSWHFITYSGTAFPLLALQMCDQLPNPAP